MLDYFRENKQFILLILIWLLVGMYGGYMIYAVLPLSLFLLKRKERYAELFIGFFFILILSDNRHRYIAHVEDIKTIYVVVLAVFYFFNAEDFKSIYNPFILFTPFLLFCILSVFLILRGETYWLTFQKTISYMLLFINVPVYIIKMYQEKQEQYFKNIIYLGVLILLIGLLMRYLNPSHAFYGGRYTGLLGNPNGLGLFCLLFFLLLTLINHHYPSLFTRNELLICYIIIVISVYMADSRNTIFAIFIFIFFYRFYKISPFLGFIIFLTFLISYQAISSNIPQITRALGVSTYFRTETLSNASGRYIAWTFAWEEIQKAFWFGKGFAYDEYLFEGVKNQNMLNWLGHQGGVHNTFLSLWLNTGLVGLVLYMGAFLLIFIKAAKNSIMAFPIMYAVLFSITYESWLMASLNPYTIQFLIILTILTSEEINVSKEKSPVPLH